MTNFQIHFDNPWLLLLLIPALALTLIPYFRLSRKYRRTRNRIGSMVLHMVVMVLCVSLLAGTLITYGKLNDGNEALILLDQSYTAGKSGEDVESYVRTLLDEARRKNVRVGIVTFGYNQVYAASASRDVDRVFNDYLTAEEPDDSATDIASALTYAASLFANPRTGKIILVSDGLETDGKASSVVKSIAAEGTKIDTVHIPTKQGADAQLVGVTMPDYNIAVGEEFEMTVSVEANVNSRVTITLYDNGVACGTATADLLESRQDVVIKHTFTLPGMHELTFRMEGGQDTVEENNSYRSFLYLETYDKVLIVERNADESAKLRELLSESYKVTVADIGNPAQMPATLAELREYDEVIFVNIANADMPKGFDKILHDYVYLCGGGLFTVGGNRIDTGDKIIANAYNREDMIGTLYQQMLPVQAINYTPPLGVMIIIDRSGSMSAKDSVTGKTKLDLAKEGALASLNALTERDWCGVMTLEDDYAEEIQMTPRTQIDKIRAAIDDIEIGGGTVFTGAIERAGSALKALKGVERRHILLVSDGMPGDSYELYGEVVKRNYEESGITFSIVSIGDNGKTEDMQAAANDGHGRYYETWNVSTLPGIMREDLNVPEIKEVNYEPFTPVIYDHTSVVNGILQENMPQLRGFYGTKAKAGVEIPLMGEYVPIYAQWKYGAGTVGSFMCDLNGTWSGDFLASPTGVRFLHNVVLALFPTEDIREKEIELTFRPDNYTTQMSIFTKLEEGQRIRVRVVGPTGATGEENIQLIEPGAGEDYSRVRFLTREPGLYTITVSKLDENGDVVAETVAYRTFSYSKEYLSFRSAKEAEEAMATIAADGKGQVLTLDDPWAAFDNFEKYLTYTFDPRYLFAILAIILFLTDVAVRKFKFKWPHELIREYRNRKSGQ